MNMARIFAVILIIGGVIGLTYGSFSYTKETHTADLGSIELSMKDRRTVNVPIWAGVAAIAIGSAFLLYGWRSREI
ncbi:MAG: putative rane protein [Fibrobacterota bacterium]|jgi:TRAP-type C4-dicarboxylate transport system permease small subunit